MSKLTLEEFRKLPKDQKAERYKELSPHDMFLWRISEPTYPTVVSRKPLTKEEEEEQKEFNRQVEQLIREKWGKR